VLAEVNCETDFVARTDEFLTFTQRLVSHALQGGNELSLDSAATINEYLTRPVSNFGAATIDETQRLLISKLQENVVVSKLITMKAGPKCTRSSKTIGVFGTYLHNTHGSYPCASSGCLIELQYNLPSLDEARRNIISEGASNLAISYLGMKPQWIDRSTVPQATIEEQHALLRKSLPNNKPEKILVDIIAGKMEKYYADHVFLDMEYVLAEDLTIKDYLRQLETDIGGTLQLKRVVTLSIK
jgi:elongation factor Ts